MSLEEFKTTLTKIYNDSNQDEKFKIKEFIITFLDNESKDDELTEQLEQSKIDQEREEQDGFACMWCYSNPYWSIRDGLRPHAGDPC